MGEINNRPQVMLIPTPPAEHFHSMDVYAGALIGPLKAMGRFSITQHPWPVPGEKRAGRLTSVLNLYYSRYLSYPAMLCPDKSSVFHVLDHTYAHLIERLPAGRTIVTCHDLIPLQVPEYTRSLGGRLSVELFRMSIRKLRRAAHIIADSGATKRSLTRLLGIQDDKITIVPLGIDPMFIRAGKNTKNKRNQKICCVLQVGATAEPYKNTGNLLKAFAVLLQRRDGHLKLMKVGKPYTSEQQKFIEENGLKASVEYIGHVKREDLPALFQMADVMLMPSLYEGFGLPVLEAMACGTPVVTSARGSIPEVSGDNVVYTEPTDPEDIAAGVERVLDDQGLRDRLVTEGKTWARAFTWERTAGATAEVYEKILQRQ